MIKRILMILYVLFIILSQLEGKDQQDFLDDLDSFENRKPLTFPQIHIHSKCTISKENNSNIPEASAEWTIIN